ncbi:MAG TPA: antibiotic biosynthesis monooxygenase, partial [Globicatella sulfidifaciens]|nr:antibiotic biosynthesis monooxygenase [Globicatella sulfidifaciens]
AKEMEKVEGCDIYSVGIATEDHSKVYSYEVWENQEAYANALIMDVFRDLITEATPFITDVQYYPTF